MAAENENGAPDSLDWTEIPVVESEAGVFTAYSNMVNVNWTLTDVQIRFGELIQQPTAEGTGSWKDQEPAIMERAAITLPWQQAKFLANSLGELVRKYEELNGELKLTTLPRL